MKHLIKIESAAHGVLGVRHTGLDQQYCEAGELVILEWQPDAKWGLQEAHYTDSNGNIVPIDLKRVKVNGKDVVVFTMPNANITVGGTFKMFVSQDWTEGINPSKGDVLTVGNNGEPTPIPVDELANEIAEGENDLVDAIDRINPFKGWYTDLASLQTTHPSPQVGDYAYVKGAESTDPAAIYECTTAGTWSDSGRTADTSNVQTFASGEEVNEMYITDDLASNNNNALLQKETFEQLGHAHLYESKNLLNFADQDYSPETYVNPSNGYLSTSSSYNTSGFIPVKEGQQIHVAYGASLNIDRYTRFIAAYNAQKSILSDKGRNLDTNQPYTVPSDVSFIRISAATTVFDINNDVIVYADSIEQYEPYFEPYREIGLYSSVLPIKIPNGFLHRFNLASGNSYESTINTQSIGGFTVQFHGNISGQFGGVKFGRGIGIYTGFCIEVTTENVNIYLNTNAEPSYTYPHSLTIKDYIDIKFRLDNFRPTLTITTNGGIYSKSDIAMVTKDGKMKVISTNTTFTNCSMSYVCYYFEMQNHLYGDSYFDLVSNDRWTSYLRNNGIKCMLNAYPGRGASSAFSQFKQDLQYCGSPKRIVWCIGMNNPDNNAINAEWKTCVDWLLENRDKYGYELVLATIPNVPTVDNTYKNAYVRNSGVRYIDFASAVGAENGTTWYDNMLSQDGVHPDVQGALALYTQALSDLPELFLDI